MFTRWEDPYDNDDQDDVPFGAPSPHPPEGRELIGVRTPLGLGRMRWTSSGKAWIKGDGFELPMTHFEPSTLEPIYGPAVGEAVAGQASRRPAMRTLEMRDEYRPRLVIDDLVYRNPRPWLAPPLKFTELSSVTTGRVGGASLAPASEWPPSAAARPSSHPAANPEPAPGSTAVEQPSEQTGAAVQRIAQTGPAYGPSSSRLAPPRPRPQGPVLQKWPTPGTDHSKDPLLDPLAASRKPRHPGAVEAAKSQPPLARQDYRGFNTPAGRGQLQRNADGTVSIVVPGETWQVAFIPSKDSPAELVPPGSPAPKHPGGAPGRKVNRIPLTPIPATNPGAKFATFEEAAADIHRQVDQRSIDDNQEIHWHYYIDASTGLWGYTDPFGSGPRGGDRGDFPVPTVSNGRDISNVAVLGGGHTHGNFAYERPEYREHGTKKKVIVTTEQLDAMNSNNWSEPDMGSMPHRRGFYTLGTPSRRNRHYDPINGDRPWS